MIIRAIWCCVLGLAAAPICAQVPEEDSLRVELVGDEGPALALKYHISIEPGGIATFRFEYLGSELGYKGDVNGSGILAGPMVHELLVTFSEQAFFDLPRTLTYKRRVEGEGRYSLRVGNSVDANLVELIPGDVDSPELMRFWFSWLAVVNAVPAQPRRPVE